MANGKSIQEVAEETLRVQEFLAAQPPGVRLTYTEIETQCGVRMDSHGKDVMRRAARRARLEYACLAGFGIELAGPANGMKIVTARLARINGTVKRADRCHEIVQARFWDEMTPDDQRRVLFLGAVFGAIRAAAESGRVLYGKAAPKLLPVTSVPIPKN